MPIHSYGQRFQSIYQYKGIKWIAVPAQYTLQFSSSCVHEFYIGAKQDSTDCCSMSIQKFSGAVHNKIHSILERLLQVWGSESVVASNLLSIFLCKLRERFNVHAL